MNKEVKVQKVVKRLLKGFYWLLGISAFLGVVVVLPYTDREAIQARGWEWWYITLAIIIVGIMAIGTMELHTWAFGNKEE